MSLIDFDHLRTYRWLLDFDYAVVAQLITEITILDDTFLTLVFIVFYFVSLFLVFVSKWE